MTIYSIRIGFTITIGDIIYMGGETVDLTDEQFELHKHKLEGTVSNTFPTVPSQNYPFDELALRGETNRETLTVDKQLENDDPSIQNLENLTGGDLNVLLPTNPDRDKFFLIINRASSTGNLIINGTILLPNERYELIHDGTEWLEL